LQNLWCIVVKIKNCLEILLQTRRTCSPNFQIRFCDSGLALTTVILYRSFPSCVLLMVSGLYFLKKSFNVFQLDDLQLSIKQNSLSAIFVGIQLKLISPSPCQGGTELAFVCCKFGYILKRIFFTLRVDDTVQWKPYTTEISQLV
jgi:hypothetical protein